MGVAYARSRTTFGKRIAERENIAAMLAECDVQVRCAQALYLFACWCADDGREFRHEASVAKLTAARVANQVADCVMQVHGAMGYSRELPIERWYRDLRVTRIYEGTDEIQLNTIARALLASTRSPGGLLLAMDDHEALTHPPHASRMRSVAYRDELGQVRARIVDDADPITATQTPPRVKP